MVSHSLAPFPTLLPTFQADSASRQLRARLHRTNHIQTVVFHTKKPPHKQHIWFLPTRKANAEKPKELFFFANARHKIDKLTSEVKS